jgi:hypothetical protein
VTSSRPTSGPRHSLAAPGVSASRLELAESRIDPAVCGGINQFPEEKATVSDRLASIRRIDQSLLLFRFRIHLRDWPSKPVGSMNMVQGVRWGREAFIFFVFLSVLLVAAQENHEKKETYTVGSGTVLTVTNDCGPITVRPSPTGKVFVTMVWRSALVKFVNEQRGRRLELHATSNSPGMSMAEYTVLVPATDMVTVRSSNGDIVVQGLRGDVALETSNSAITVSDITDAHLKARTLDGTINLKGVHHSHVDLYSVKGDIHLHNVGGSWLEGQSVSGRITYDGDPGVEGEYKLSSHFGNLEVSIPSDATVEIKARSLKSNEEVHLPAIAHQNSFLKPSRGNTSRFTLRSIRGDIQVLRP